MKKRRYRPGSRTSAAGIRTRPGIRRDDRGGAKRRGRRQAAAAALLLGGLLAAGCETIYQPGRGDEARHEALRLEMERRQTARDLEVLKTQAEDFRLHLERLDTRLERLENEMRQGGATRAELDALRRDVELLRAERETLRKAVVDDLGREMARLLAEQQPLARAAAGAPARGSGWEHKVQPGQTLSEIAAAYKVPVARIKEANNLKSDLIRAGEVLFIPD